MASARADTEHPAVYPGRLRDVLREDWRTNQPRALARPGFHVLVMYRLGHAAGHSRGPTRLPVRTLRAIFQLVARLLYGVELPWQTTVGRRTVIGHQGGSVISEDAVIGDDCLIRQNVTIGAAHEGGRSPRIGTGVQIGAGAVIVGDIDVGAGAIIGPNSVVTTDVPPGARVVAAPSRILPAAGEAAPAVEGSEFPSADPEGVAAVIRDALGLQASIDADTPLLTAGLIDSLNLILAIDALESTYGVAVRSEDVVAESFDTPRQIADHLRAGRA